MPHRHLVFHQLVTLCLCFVAICYGNETSMLLSGSELQERVFNSPDAWVVIYASSPEELDSKGSQALREKLSTNGINCGIVNCLQADSRSLCKLVNLPSMHLYVSDPAVNPYTKKLYRQSIPFSGNQELRSIERFVSKSIPLSLVPIETVEQLNNVDEKVVMLFAEKDSVSMFYKSLSFQYRNSFKFSQISKSSELLNHFSIATLPALGLFDPATKEIKLFPGIISSENRNDVVSWMKEFLPVAAAIDDMESPAKVSSLGFNELLMNEAYVLAVTRDGKIDDEELRSDWNKLKKWSTGSIQTKLLDCSVNDNTASSLGSSLCGAKKIAMPYLFVVPFGDSRKKILDLTDKSLSAYSFTFNQIELVKKVVAESLPEKSVKYIENEGMMMQFVGDSQSKSMVSVIVLSNKEVPPLYLRNVALSLESVAQVGYMNAIPASIANSVGNMNLPTAVALYPQEETGIQMFLYESSMFGPLKYFSLVQFGRVAYSRSGFEKKSLDSEASTVHATTHSGLLHSVKEESDWQRWCGTSFKGICVLGLEKDDESDDVTSLLQSYIAQSSAAFSFMRVNGICQMHFAESFDIQENNLPTVVVYSPAKGRYAEFKGSLAEKSIKEFLDGILSGKVSTSVLQTRPVISDVCNDRAVEVIHEEEDASDFLAEIKREEAEKAAQMKAELEEELKKKKEKGATDKKKKPKKKKNSKKKSEL